MTITRGSRPRLADSRQQAHSRLTQFYLRHDAAMGVSETLEALLSQPQLQRKYEALETAVDPGDVMCGCFPAINQAGRWLPDPVEYLRVQGLWHKVHELFQEPENRRVIRTYLRSNNNPDWVDNNLDGWIGDAVATLINPNPLTGDKRSKTNDYVCFLSAWRDTHDLPAETARTAQNLLVINAVHNAARRATRYNAKFVTGFDPAILDRIADIGGRIGTGYAGSVKDYLADQPSLTHEERDVLRLRFDEACTYKQIGEALSLPLSTVYARFQSALAKLRS